MRIQNIPQYNRNLYSQNSKNSQNKIQPQKDLQKQNNPNFVGHSPKLNIDSDTVFSLITLVGMPILFCQIVKMISEKHAREDLLQQDIFLNDGTYLMNTRNL
ncbi:MAG: hypothetical protein R3Y28_00395 [Candidatus Gastranaerophilales bacterium]